ncbi:hypothetical protein CPB83DRAFT_846728 [Crepidotus variabilis]|uniref:Uncharacterized protein n=1 Tax=Crepidotus variabilis TaxID=179855 RepID=A0A9P6EQ13_9AGAR|nr:hypothetical protein CPB83DRAFT_846728 [Crepidotus variabilis]
MSESQKALSALNLLLDNCRIGLTALVDGSLPDNDQLNASFSTIRTDFGSILSLLYSSATKVALALKPAPSPQYKAALVPLQDLSNNTAALVHSVRLMRQSQGATLVLEYEGLSKNILVAIQAFANGLSQSNLGSHEETFIAVGKLHELIDNAKKPNVLSSDNRAAVRRRWVQDYESLVDGWEELQDIDKTSDMEDGDEDEFDDGWDELGSKQTFAPSELERIEKVRALVKVANLLHTRVVKDLLSSNTHKQDNVTLDNLATYSAQLLSASDELISSMYTPQQPTAISLHLSSYLGALKAIQHALNPKNEDLEQQLSALSVSNASLSKKTKWLKTCFDLIDKAGAQVSETLVAVKESS